MGRNNAAAAVPSLGQGGAFATRGRQVRADDSMPNPIVAGGVGFIFRTTHRAPHFSSFAFDAFQSFDSSYAGTVAAGLGSFAFVSSHSFAELHSFVASHSDSLFCEVVIVEFGSCSFAASHFDSFDFVV